MNDPKDAAAYHPGDAPVTRPDLDAIQARADAAAEGPWDHQPYGPQNQNGDHSGANIFDAHGEYLVHDVSDRDGAFIAHAREDVPALLAALAAERARADRAEQRIADAPHSVTCLLMRAGSRAVHMCTCWKSAAPTTEQ